MRVLVLLNQLENVRHAELSVYNRALAEERHLLHHAQVQGLLLPPTPISDAPLPPHARHQLPAGGFTDRALAQDPDATYEYLGGSLDGGPHFTEDEELGLVAALKRTHYLTPEEKEKVKFDAAFENPSLGLKAAMAEFNIVTSPFGNTSFDNREDEIAAYIATVAKLDQIFREQ